MKIFETFPEGIALIRNDYILYSNRALKHILNCGTERSVEDDPLYEMLKNDLKISCVQQWVKSKADLKKLGLSEPKQISIWSFLMGNEKGAIFQLLPKKRDLNDENYENDFLDDYLNEIPRYITLNQVNVKIAGGTDKLLVIRDVTSIVMNEKIMETKREMSKLTETMMKQIDDHTSLTEQRLSKLDQYLATPGQPISDDCQMEIKKMQYRIKDFQQVYLISENKFRPSNESTSVKNCVNEIVEMTFRDLKTRNIDLQVTIAPEVPESISCDLHKVK